MAIEPIELIETPDPCEDMAQYDNRIEDEVELEPEEEDQEDYSTRKHWEDFEQQFARYERNFRARRIRELTLAPVRKRGLARVKRAAVKAAA